MNLRSSMPETAAFIDGLRLAFGAESINASVRSGMAGQPTFHAAEAGHVVGTALVVGPMGSADDWLAASAYVALVGKRGRQ